MNVIDQWHLKVQHRIEEWIFERTCSFEGLSKCLYTRRQALAYIRRQSKLMECNDRRFDLQCVRSNLHEYHWFFHITICGEMFFLKKSVEKYCQTGKGWFPLSEGF